MYRRLTVAVIIPCYQERPRLSAVLRAIPDYVDHIVVVDDGSTDGTGDIAHAHACADARTVVLSHDLNRGPGAAVSTGYAWALHNRVDLVAVIDGDGQADPLILERLLDPVAADRADYAKGDRLSHPGARRSIPVLRLTGNLILSALTRLLSGYKDLRDSQNGYTVIGAKALRAFDWSRAHSGYGRPLELLVWLGRRGFRVANIPHEPRYGVGERSKMSLPRDVIVIGGLLLRLAVSKPPAARH